MNPRLLIQSSLVALALNSAAAADTPAPASPPSYSYEFAIAGVVCSSCSSAVKRAVEACSWAESARVIKGGHGELPKLVIITNRSSLEAREVQAVLGDRSQYQIQSPGTRSEKQ